MKLRKDKNKKEPVRLNKQNKKKKSLKINRNDLQMILLLLILFLILFVLIPLAMYTTGSLESTTYYYRLNSTAGMIITTLI